MNEDSLRTARVASVLVLLAGAGILAVGLAWQAETEDYLRGVAHEAAPPTLPPLARAEALLARLGPAPTSLEPGQAVEDPRTLLQDTGLLATCGNAVNAFVSLAPHAGLEARRLLLLDEDGLARHVVAEVRLNGSWVVADPLFRTLLRGADGGLLNREELRDPAVLRAATAGLPAYDATYVYDRVAYVRTDAVPLAGPFARSALDMLFPPWESSVNWVAVVDRPPVLVVAAGVFIVAHALALLAVLMALPYRAGEGYPPRPHNRRGHA